MFLRAALSGLLLVLIWGQGVALAQTPTPAQAAQLAKARQAFNQGRFDEAIAAAIDARKAPALAASARLVLGRAYLGRFDAKADGADLSAAHDALASLDATKVPTTERRDLTIGLGLTVFFEGRPGAAAELLEVALTTPAEASSADPRAREKLFDWWATAVDRAAQLVPDAGRRQHYERIVKRSEAELARDPQSVAAGYWLAVGARGASSLDRAWHAAIAAWIRSKNDTAARADIDQLMVAAIIPERARALDPHATSALVAAMRAEWEQIKTSW